MKLLVLNVAGLANGLAKRPDLSENISNIMEMGAYVPVFPEFPALDAPAQAAISTGFAAQEHGILSGAMPDLSLQTPAFWVGKNISTFRWIVREAEAASPEQAVAAEVALVGLTDLADALRRIGPRDPGVAAEFRKVDARIGELAKLAKQRGMETVVVSGSPVFPVVAPIDVRKPGWNVVVEQQIAHVFGPKAEMAKAAKTIDKGIKVLVGREEKSLYHVDHPRAGDVVLISPMNKSFEPSRGAQGHLPMQIDDYGVFVASVPVPSIQRRPFIRLTEVAGVLKQLLAS